MFFCRKLLAICRSVYDLCPGPLRLSNTSRTASLPFNILWFVVFVLRYVKDDKTEKVDCYLSLISRLLAAGSFVTTLLRCFSLLAAGKTVKIVASLQSSVFS